MKLISFTVPCYNSQAYMEKCIESILKGGEDVEIIIVNDGSTDDTLKIAESYARKYPSVVKVIDKENGGHGSGVNAGVRKAEGIYTKVVDSDDWVDESALKKLLETIKNHMESGTLPDLYITNFIYDHVSDNTRYVSDYVKMMPENEFFGWDKVKRFRTSHLLLMHALLFRRDVYLASGTVLPEHTYYVDDIYCYKPLPQVKTIFYLNVDLYHYFIGRADQSVNIVNFTKNYEMQIRVMKEIVDSYTYAEIKKMPEGLKNYMIHAVCAFMITTELFIGAKYSPERKEAFGELWRYIKKRDKKLYGKLRYRSYSTLANIFPWRLRGKIMVLGYKIACKRVKLG
ncbi:MAG: glycosyltransferase [Clostridia bacterium]|nr:glycosyltransferase [Clostridia bacterium]